MARVLRSAGVKDSGAGSESFLQRRWRGCYLPLASHHNNLCLFVPREIVDSVSLCLFVSEPGLPNWGWSHTLDARRVGGFFENDVNAPDMMFSNRFGGSEPSKSFKFMTTNRPKLNVVFKNTSKACFSHNIDVEGLLFSRP